jgi:hypothetical protein
MFNHRSTQRGKAATEEDSALAGAVIAGVTPLVADAIAKKTLEDSYDILLKPGKNKNVNQSSPIMAVPKTRKAVLFFSAFCFFAGMANLHSQDSQESQGTDDSDRNTTLQKTFPQFPFFTQVTNEDGQPEFQTLTLTNPVVIDRERIFGFRFKVPTRTDHEDLVWAFVEPGDFKEWYIVPQTGEMDGFTNYYYTTKGDYMKAKPLLPMNGRRLIYQYLAGDSLTDGQTYLVWFGFGNHNPPAMSLTFTFTNFDINTPHPLLAFEKILSLSQLASEPIVNPYNHHTYILLRPATWARSEALAIRLGGHLATIRSQAEEDWIFKTFGRYGGARRHLWIGLNDLDNRFHFSWTSGESVSYTDWAPNEPDNAGPRGQDYVAIFYPGHSRQNKWNDWHNKARDPIGMPMDGVVEIIPTNNPAIPQPEPLVANDVAVQIHPDVTICSENGSIKLEWPISASDYVLVATTNLSQSFTPFGYSETTNSEAGIIFVTISNSAQQMFFRLVKQ